MLYGSRSIKNIYERAGLYGRVGRESNASGRSRRRSLNLPRTSM